MTVTKRHMIRGTCGLAAAAFALGAAMTGPASSPLARMSPLGTQPAEAARQLAAFADCEELREWYLRETLPHVTPWGLDSGVELLGMAEEAARADTSSPATPALGNGPTGTNVQEAGVDEPDTAKTFGEFVISVRAHTLLVTDVSGATPRVVARRGLDGHYWSYELLVVGDRAVVLGRTWGGSFDGVRLLPGFSTTSQISMTTVDLGDPTRPVVVDRRAFTGDLAAAREYEGTVRLVLTQTSVNLPFVYPKRGLSRRAALQQNEDLVAGADLEAWLPHYVGENGQAAAPLVDCNDVRHPRRGSGLGTITVLTVDPTSPDELEKDAITADGSLVYVSDERLYVATVANGWSTWQEGSRDVGARSTVHAFATEGAVTAYVASGRIDGVIPDRWAFSEHEGLLRVASTRGRIWSPTDTAVTVLSEQNERLVAIGEVGGLGEREQITAVRWLGDLAVIVTFHQTDPLYTLDLSDPTAPRVTGELKITGFSRYLHPVGSDIVLGVGQSATRSGTTKGSQVSTFDPGDVSRIQKLGLGSSYSPVEDDPRAFTYLPDLRIARIPSTDWEKGSQRLNVIAVGMDGSLSLRQQIRISGSVDQVRALPLALDRVAVTVDGRVDQILALD
jgi:hypothetical protein